MSFSITPIADFAEQTSDGFPQFIQFQADETNLGGPDAETLNFGPGLVATRGVGEQSGIVTVDVGEGIQWQFEGSDLGPAGPGTVNLSEGLTATQANGIVTIGVAGAPPSGFIQWAQDGVPVGDDLVHHVNVLSPLVATRNSGLGASEIVLTVVPPQWQAQGIDAGNPDVIIVGDNLTVSFPSGLNAVRIDGVASYPEWQQGSDFGNARRIVVGTGITLSVASGEPDTIQLSVPQFTLTDVAGDHTLQASDLNNGLSTSGTTGTQNIVVAADAQLGGGDLNGKSVLIYVEGAAAVDVLAVSGVNVHVRSGLLAVAAGQYATLTLVHTRHANDWVLCGDLSS